MYIYTHTHILHTQVGGFVSAMSQLFRSPSQASTLRVPAIYIHIHEHDESTLPEPEPGKHA